MNERIKALALQAGIEFTYDPTETPMGEFVEAWDGDLEKFAQLIVAECIALIYEDDGATHHAELLEEHFGVDQ
jgi:hypothetical protein